MDQLCQEFEMMTLTEDESDVYKAERAGPMLLVPEFIPLKHNRMGRYEALPEVGIPMLFGPTPEYLDQLSTFPNSSHHLLLIPQLQIMQE
ncbi:unnamed protein product [Bursaphelenchus xylophilus]|uniref:(pine wood nematode) hypothetical protein n=1 Tax=Bursaphelenchus xylophilus TaxID=6326 RepID=A0A1I7S0B9_BURXY|nr:unnamed protein product [Bursaphelenchus xylophilus]CAG9132189.1 unnamed protein product [Bursaphelenchus xylophilus]